MPRHPACINRMTLTRCMNPTLFFLFATPLYSLSLSAASSCSEISALCGFPCLLLRVHCTLCACTNTCVPARCAEESSLQQINQSIRASKTRKITALRCGEGHSGRGWPNECASKECVGVSVQGGVMRAWQVCLAGLSGRSPAAQKLAQSIKEPFQAGLARPGLALQLLKHSGSPAACHI
jgi:hypothetical protein